MAMDYSTAAGAYGFAHLPVLGNVQAETSVGANIDSPGVATGPLSLGTQNPLFWLLILFLVFTGWIFGAFDFGVKNIGSVAVKAGRK